MQIMKSIVRPAVLCLVVLLTIFSQIENVAQGAGAVPGAPGTVAQDQQGKGSGRSRKIVEVKFREGERARAFGGAVSGLDAGSAAALADILRRYPVRSIAPVFTLPEQTLNRLREKGQRQGGKALPDLNLWLRFKLRRGADRDLFIQAMRGLPIVEKAEAALTAQPLPATTPSFVGNQGYLGAPTDGIGAQLAWTVPGGTGANVTIYDAEYNWLQSHEDLDTAAGVTLLLNGGDSNSPPGYSGCPAPCDSLNREHGTAVLGELIGTNDSIGITGMAHGASLGLAPANTTNLGYNLGNAITLATNDGGAGDVILIEQQATVCGIDLGPSEVAGSVFSAIQTAVANGIVVVEAAGNGGVNLDAPACGTTFDPTVQDSGAIIVGAGQPPGTNDRVREGFSTYGTRVNVQGWGSAIWSSGYGDGHKDSDNTGDANKWYTNSFGGTSGASPMVTAAAAIIQSARNSAGMGFLTPAQMRTLLINTGSAQQGNTAEHIGPRVNVAGALVSTLTADMQVTKSDSPDPVVIGANLTYTMGVTNAGPGIAGSATFADTVPTNTTFVSLSAPAGWSCTTPSVGGTGTVNCSKALVANGEAGNFTLVVKVNSNTTNGTVLSNTATVGASNNTPSANDSATATTATIASADLEMDKTDSPDPVIAGTELTYNLTFTNNGPSDAQTVTLDDTVPAHTTFVSFAQNTGDAFNCTTPAVGGTGNIHCTRTSWAPGAATFTLKVFVLANTADGSTLSNTATGASTTTDPTPSNNSKIAQTTVITRADLEVTKLYTVDGFAGAGTITYDITLVNNGPSDAQNVTLTDPLDSTTALVSATADNGGVCAGNPVVVCSWTTVPAGATRLIKIIADLKPEALNLSNTATGASDTVDPDPGNNDSTVSLVVPTKADVSIVVTAEATGDGRKVRYTLTVNNTGPSVARRVLVTDKLAKALKVQDLTTSFGTCKSKAAIKCKLGPPYLYPNTPVSIIIKTEVVTAVPTVKNFAKVKSITFDPDLSNNNSSVDTILGGGMNQESLPTYAWLVLPERLVFQE